MGKTSPWIHLVCAVALGTILLTPRGVLAESCPANTSGLCPGYPCTITQSHTYDNACTLNFAGDVTIASGVTLATGGATGQLFAINATSLTVQGTLKAQAGVLNVNTTGDFTAQVVGTSAATVDVKNQGQATIVAGGACALNGKDIITDGQNGAIHITCASVTGSGPVHANNTNGYPSGTIEIASTTGPVTLTNLVAANGTVGSAGGAVRIRAATMLSLGSGAVEAKGTGGNGGTIELCTGTSTSGTLCANVSMSGPAIIHSPLTATCTATGCNGGGIDVKAASIVTDTIWSANGASTGGSVGISLRATPATGSGSITTLSGNTMTATSGLGDSVIQIWSSGDVALSGDLLVNGTASGGGAGEVSIVGGPGHTLTIGSAVRIAADAVTGGSPYQITACGYDVNIAGDFDTHGGSAGGLNAIQYLGTLVITSTASIDAGSTVGGTNDILCCLDSDKDGTCDSSVCSNPVLDGTITPAATTHVATGSCYVQYASGFISPQ
jgi:hypothetical protein